ncbi:hypothetical protein LNQ03_08505 [Klebsiella pneumoniae subsp. pneumoniae]|nr:hypothetical protein [Klebsiella pneumoniae subsp. pneumoniae]
MQGVLRSAGTTAWSPAGPPHAGPTPMRLRQDALRVATHIMQEVVAVAGRSQKRTRHRR